MNRSAADREAARRRYRARVREALKRSEEAFLGQYGAEVEALLGLSREEIDAITPDVTDLQTYDRLIEVVKQASRMNLAQAELRSRIEEMGELAVRIARKVPRLASVLGV